MGAGGAAVHAEFLETPFLARLHGGLSSWAQAAPPPPGNRVVLWGEFGQNSASLRKAQWREWGQGREEGDGGCGWLRREGPVPGRRGRFPATCSTRSCPSASGTFCPPPKPHQFKSPGPKMRSHFCLGAKINCCQVEKTSAKWREHWSLQGCGGAGDGVQLHRHPFCTLHPFSYLSHD